MLPKDVNKEEEVDEEEVDRVDEGEDSKALEVKMLKEKKRNKDMNSSLTVGEDTRLVKSEPILVLDLTKAWSEEARAAAAAARKANGGPSEHKIEEKMGSPRPADIPSHSGEGLIRDNANSPTQVLSDLMGVYGAGKSAAFLGASNPYNDRKNTRADLSFGPKGGKEVAELTDHLNGSPGWKVEGEFKEGEVNTWTNMNNVRVEISSAEARGGKSPAYGVRIFGPKSVK